MIKPHTVKTKSKNYLTLNPLSPKFIGKSRRIIRVYSTILWDGPYRIKMLSMSVSKERCTSDLAGMNASQMHL